MQLLLRRIFRSTFFANEAKQVSAARMQKDDQDPTINKKLGRPVSEGTQAVKQVLRDLGAVGDCVEGATWREVFAQAKMSRRSVQSTLQHMVEREEVGVVGVRRLDGVAKPLRLFVLKETLPFSNKAGSGVLEVAMFRICGPVPEAANDD